MLPSIVHPFTSATMNDVKVSLYFILIISKLVGFVIVISNSADSPGSRLSEVEVVTVDRLPVSLYIFTSS